MERSSDFVQKAIKYIESNEFDNATVTITGMEDENNESYDDILGCLVKLFSREIIPKEKIPEIVSKVATIYDQNKTDSTQLKKQLDSLLSSFGLVAGKISEDQKLDKLSSWTDMQLKERIKELQQEQRNLLNAGKELNPKIGEQLKKLLEEHSKRLGYKGKKIESSEPDKNEQESTEKPVGADSWFVIPSEKELEGKIKTHVVSGSPIIKVLRSKYVAEYKVKKILDVDTTNLANLSADDAYETKRELNRQKDFVSNYLDPTLVVDQDICAYEIASEFLTDQYKKPELVRIDEGLSCYVFKSGYLKDSFNPDTAQHTFIVEGNIIGRFSICLNRKEPSSGRFISDSYDIVEFQDGQPCFYFYSSKGVSALSGRMIESIKLTTKSTSFDLKIPDPSEIGKPMTKEDLEAFIMNCRKKKSSKVSQDRGVDMNQEAKNSQGDNREEKNLNTDIPNTNLEKKDNKETEAKEVVSGEEVNDLNNTDSAPVSTDEKKSNDSTEDLNELDELDDDSVAVETDTANTNDEIGEENNSVGIEAEGQTTGTIPAGEESGNLETSKSKSEENNIKKDESATESTHESNNDSQHLEEADSVSAGEQESDKTLKNTGINGQNEDNKDLTPIDVNDPYLNVEIPEIDKENLTDINTKTEKENKETDITSLQESPEITTQEEGEKSDDLEGKPDLSSMQENTEEGEHEDPLNLRIDRLEEIAVHSLESLDKMEKKISKLDEFIDVIQKNIDSSDSDKNDNSQNSNKDEEKHVLKKRATAIKASMKKKNDKADE